MKINSEGTPEGEHKNFFHNEVEIGGVVYNFEGNIIVENQQKEISLLVNDVEQNKEIASVYAYHFDNMEDCDLYISYIKNIGEIGLGSFLFRNILAYADSKHMRCTLYSGSGTGRLSKKDLEEWYKKYGFMCDSENKLWLREPKDEIDDAEILEYV